MPITDATLSPSLPQLLDRNYAANLAYFFRRLDAAGFAQVLGAAQAEATERGLLAAIAPLGDAQAAVEDFARLSSAEHRLSVGPWDAEPFL